MIFNVRITLKIKIMKLGYFIMKLVQQIFHLMMEPNRTLY